MRALIVWFLTVVAIMVLSFGCIYAYAVWDIDQRFTSAVYFVSLLCVMGMSLRVMEKV